MARIVLSEQTADRIQQLIDKQYKPGDKIPAEKRDAINAALTSLKEAVKNQNIADIETYTKTLEEAWQAAMAEMGGAQGGAQGGPQGPQGGNYGPQSGPQNGPDNQGPDEQ
mgnify:CR=1 FL=1